MHGAGSLLLPAHAWCLGLMLLSVAALIREPMHRFSLSADMACPSAGRDFLFREGRCVMNNASPFPERQPEFNKNYDSNPKASRCRNLRRTIRHQTANTAGKSRTICGTGCERTENHDSFGSQLGIWKTNHSVGSASKTCRTLWFCGRKNAVSKKIKNFFIAPHCNKEILCYTIFRSVIKDFQSRRTGFSLPTTLQSGREGRFFFLWEQYQWKIRKK